MTKIVLTGGGTAGHVTPNMALIPTLIEHGMEIHYIGSYNGIEKDLMQDYPVTYHGIESGCLRRYITWKNVKDAFRVIRAFPQAKKLLRQINPDVVFSKGGYVAPPIVIEAKRLGIPVVIHESDITPGLANKMCFSSASTVCCNFPETLAYLPKGKSLLTGSPIRADLFEGDAVRGREFCGLFGSNKPVLLITGGSLGAKIINDTLRQALPKLLPQYDIVHLCGKGKLDESLTGTKGYCQFEYVTSEMKDLMKMADMVISRAGANSICELLALHKPNLLIPLGLAASRGDQILNADSFEKQGFSMKLMEEDLTADSLTEAVEKLKNTKDTYVKAMEEAGMQTAVKTITDLLVSYADKKNQK